MVPQCFEYVLPPPKYKNPDTEGGAININLALRITD